MTNPTGAGNAQVQDDADRIMQIAAGINAAKERHGDSELLQDMEWLFNKNAELATALREAEQRGMLRGASIALGFQNNNRDSITSSLARCIAEQIKAVAERAATPEAEG